MDEQGATFKRLFAELLFGAVLAGANILFIILLGHWVAVTGVAALLIFGLTVFLALSGQTEWRRRCSDLLLALTMLNFNGWAFSHLSNLLVFLGLFFFALFGLIMGAALFSFLAHFKPLPKAAVVAAGLLFVLGAWWGGLVLEASYVPEDALQFCYRSHRRLAHGVTPQQQREAIVVETNTFLEEHYGSSGVFGYLRWGLSSGQAPLNIPGRTKPAVFKLRQQKVWLWLRLAVSLVLLCFGVFSQLNPLVRPPVRPPPLPPLNQFCRDIANEIDADEHPQQD